MDDLELVRQSLAGQTDAYARLIEHWAVRLVALCHARMGHPPDAVTEELVRSVLLQAFENLGAIPEQERFAPWVADMVLASCPAHNGVAAEAEAGTWLRRLERLPGEARLVLLPHLYQPSSYRELAHFLDLSVSAVASRLARARLALRESIPPTESADCEQYRTLLSTRLDSEIREREAELLDLHLSECPTCKALEGEWAEQSRALQAALEEVRQQAQRFATGLRDGFLARGPRKCSVLVVDDEPAVLHTLHRQLLPHFDVVTAPHALAARAILAQRSIDIILTDQRMPGMSGVQLLEWVAQNHPSTIRLLMTGFTELEDAIEAINRGHVYYYLLKPWRLDDLLQIFRNAADKFNLERKREELLRELQTLNRELERRVAERTRELEEANLLLQQRTRELERLALTDPLTGLFNRRAIEELVRFELKRHARYPSALALGYVDIDHFKQINTDYHLTGGDEVLKALARILTGSLREVDSVGRVGGEEFLVVAREANQEGTAVLAERIRATVANTPIEYNGQKITVTVSVGFAVAEAGVPATHEGLVEVAAAALADAKANGRNRCEIRQLVSESDKAEVSAVSV
jgi:diguanylate cyclase (GGDEF)-like protein